MLTAPEAVSAQCWYLRSRDRIWFLVPAWSATRRSTHDAHHKGREPGPEPEREPGREADHEPDHERIAPVGSP